MAPSSSAHHLALVVVIAGALFCFCAQPAAQAAVVSVLGVPAAGNANAGKPQLLFPGGKRVTVNISAPADEGDFLAGAYGRGTGFYYVLDPQSHLYQVRESDGTVGGIWTLEKLFSPQCLAFDESSGVLVALGRGGTFVFDPSRPHVGAKRVGPGSYNVSYCRVDDGAGVLYFLQGQWPDSIFSLDLRGNGFSNFRNISGVEPRPLSVNPFSKGLLFLSDNAPNKQWGGSSTLNLLDPASGKTLLSYDYSVPEDGSPPAHCANQIVALDASDPSHISFENIMWDNSNGFLCTAGVQFMGGKFSAGSFKFAAFGVVRPGSFKALDLHAVS